MIKNILKLGKVIKQGKTTFRLVIQDKKELYLIAILLNGNLILKTNKDKYKNYLDKLNKYLNKGKLNYPSINYINSSILPSLNDN
jgi:hypothetical protein